MIDAYVNRIATRYKTGISREHSYRGDLQTLIEALNPGVLVTNEPARIACGAPDYILTRNNIPIGYIEAKDIGVSLSKTDASEQMTRYKSSLDNLILTDYCEFWWYRNGAKVEAVVIAEARQGKIISTPQTHERFTQLIHDFCLHVGQTITSAQQLAEMMAGKAKMMQLVIENALTSDDCNDENTTLHDQMAAFKKILIHDITPNEFADIYAQTLAYGMFAARLHDQTLGTFTRQEAAELIPKTNPFLRKLFSYIAGIDIDTRIVWIVDALADIFRAADIAAILKNFGTSTQTRDPMIHFYETFLAAYNPKLRKSRGVWYTPEPVVNFIVRAVDDILKTEFGLPQGLADTSKTTIEVDTHIEDRRSKTGYTREKQDAHKVQILDPAAGTGTFLAEVVKHIHKKFVGQQGIWSSYVEQHLIPRLHGFEILMASYAMAHLKLELLLQETGYAPETQQRLRVFLTNSLEDAHPDTRTFWATWLSKEAIEANYIKRETPVMVVIGNPPYSGESANKGDWITSLMDDYKKEPGGQEKLREKNFKWINDDYVKFLRYAQYFIEKNGEGIVAFINPHGFLDNPTFRGMRWHLLKTYDTIYTIDLHGNSKKKEACPDGSPDENVFDIQQGVSINIFVKTGRKKAHELGKVFHYDLYGKREEKYDFLFEHSIKTVPYNKLTNIAPNYFFVQKDFDSQQKYDEGFLVKELFSLNTVGIVTSNDAVLIDDSKDILLRKVEDYYNIEANQYFIRKISYRPFDEKVIYYDRKFIERAREKVMQHFLKGENVGLVIARQCASDWRYIFTTKQISDLNLTGTAGRFGSGYAFPLYLYSENIEQTTIEQRAARTPNLNLEIVQRIADALGLRFVPEPPPTPSLVRRGEGGWFSPLDLLDYMYAVLHSPTYREKYKEFLKIDFPRVPYPKDQETFWRLVEFGGELRQLHLLESPKVEQYITTYPQSGDNTVTRKMTKNDYEWHEGQPTGRVWINNTQYFDHVPSVAWEFYIGGYQPAQKWLKDRYGRQLSFEDILHYQKIIVALAETDRIMQEIDHVDVMA